ncbi:MAG TPA: hypothetical protein VEP29_05110, partial [Desulfatiglandales bacterium]|nr:hypothetical protein [Desulfatiglandales bacterium]
MLAKRELLYFKGRGKERHCIGLAIDFFIALCLLIGASTSVAFSKPEIAVSSDSIFQGDVGLVRVQTTNGDFPQVQWMNQELFLVPYGNERTWFGFFGADLKVKPGSYPLGVKTASTGARKQ